jgi:type II secretory pathway pseudopilin PulG
LASEQGLTLIEVVMTVTIAVSLTALATFGVNRYLNNGKNRIAQADLATLKAAVRLYILDKGFPTSFTPEAALVPEYIPDLLTDPFARDGSLYVIERRTDPSDGVTKIYIGSRGPDGNVNYSGDDIFFYVR